MWSKIKDFIKKCFTDSPAFFGIFVGYLLLFVGFTICVSFGGACMLVGALVAITFAIKATHESDKRSSRW